MRQRHVPHRTCIVCRAKKPKAELHRVVRSPAGEILADPGGREPGRGAYLCDGLQCWIAGVERGRLVHALRGVVTTESKIALIEFARTKFGSTDQA